MTRSRTNLFQRQFSRVRGRCLSENVDSIALTDLLPEVNRGLSQSEIFTASEATAALESLQTANVIMFKKGIVRFIS